MSTSVATATSRPRPWHGAQGLAAVGVLAVLVVWRGVLLRDSFFNQDDFYLTGRAWRADLDLAFLTADTAGHVNPLQQLVYWLVAHHAPYEWGVVGAFVLGMQVLAVVVGWHVLTRVLGERWVRVPLLAVLAWSPLTLATTLWWSAAMGLWPHVVCSLLAVLLLLRAHDGAGRRWSQLLGVLAVTALGLLWHERAVLVPPVVLATAVCLEAPVGWRRLPRALRRWWPLWTGYGVLLAAYLLAHAALTTVEGGGTTLGDGLSISWAFVGENVLPGLAGGPWDGRLDGGAVEPAAWVVVASALLAVLVTAVLLRLGGPARWWAFAFFVAYVVADLALVLSGRGGFGRVIGLDPRYSSDVVHAAVLCVALALRGGRPIAAESASPRRWRRRRTLAVAVATGLYLVGSALGTTVLVPGFQNVEDRSWLTNVRGSLAADADQVLVDDLAPVDIVLPLVGEDSLLSRILAPLPEWPLFDLPSSRVRVVTEAGHLVEPRLVRPARSLPGPVPVCGHPVRSAPRVVALGVDVRGRVLGRVSYFTDRESTLVLEADGDERQWSAPVLARPGPNEVHFVLPDLGSPVEELRLRATGIGPRTASTICVTEVVLGGWRRS